ncbi:MAG TPA: type II toxin-antitoxin system RelE/ParE family toxin [Allosphingosinicella sp.]|nr:type II toxin-antitoxin system RelE/ParE family toxin [Allosphingosinicella sp.]
MIVRLTAQAERDLEAIADHIAKDDPARALGFVRDLRDSCLGLADFPHRFPLLPRYERYGVRHRVHGNYLIFYRAEADQVTVIHILHGAMDYAGILFPG